MASRRDEELLRLAELVDRAEGLRVASLPFDDLRELGRLYRRHSARLARLRGHGDDPDQTRALNALLVRAYTFLYGTRARQTPARASADTIADTIARTWSHQVAAWTLLLLGAAVGFGLAWGHHDALAALVPSGLGYTPSQLERLVDSPEARAEFLARDETPAARNFFFGSMLFVHNTRVGLLSFATGIFAAVPTVLLQIYNGLTLGALASVFLASESRWLFLAWILPHGVPELTAICLCAAAGLALGAAVAAPGRRGVSAALREAAAPATALFLSSIPMFLLAAAIESFVRESALGTPARTAVACAMGGLVISLLAAVRRLARRRQADSSWLEAFSDPRRSAVPGSD